MYIFNDLSLSLSLTCTRTLDDKLNPSSKIWKFPNFERSEIGATAIIYRIKITYTVAEIPSEFQKKPLRSKTKKISKKFFHKGSTSQTEKFKRIKYQFSKVIHKLKRYVLLLHSL